MNLLLITGPLWPNVGNNANLIRKLLPFIMREHHVEILSLAFGAVCDELPKTICGVAIHWAVEDDIGWQHKTWFSLLSKIKKEPGYHGEFGAKLIEDAALKLRNQYEYDVILCTMQPYAATLAASRIPGVAKILYLMDPPDFVFDSLPWGKDQKQLPSALEKMDSILTTPFIQEAVRECGKKKLYRKITPVSFPHIENNDIKPTKDDIPMDSERINLLFCGALFPSVRSPDCFLNILKRLDERFSLVFMGRNCEAFWKQCAVDTRAEVRIYPPQPYQIALNAMQTADVLINLGNNMKVHMPSKTLDYINAGKPVVNFYKFEDCPTLFYTKRYPLCLNIYEKEFELERDTAQFIDYCIANKGKRVSRSIIEERFYDCCPQAIADVLLRELQGF